MVCVYGLKAKSGRLRGGLRFLDNTEIYLHLDLQQPRGIFRGRGEFTTYFSLTSPTFTSSTSTTFGELIAVDYMLQYLHKQSKRFVRELTYV